MLNTSSYALSTDINFSNAQTRLSSARDPPVDSLLNGTLLGVLFDRLRPLLTRCAAREDRIDRSLVVEVDDAARRVGRRRRSHLQLGGCLAFRWNVVRRLESFVCCRRWPRYESRLDATLAVALDEVWEPSSLRTSLSRGITLLQSSSTRSLGPAHMRVGVAL